MSPSQRADLEKFENALRELPKDEILAFASGMCDAMESVALTTPGAGEQAAEIRKVKRQIDATRKQ